MFRMRNKAFVSTTALAVSVGIFSLAGFAARAEPGARKGAHPSASGHVSMAGPAAASASSSVAPTTPPNPRAVAPEGPVPKAGKSGCTASGCHAGIEPIRAASSGMMSQIRSEGVKFGDPEGCVVCHGGDPKATSEQAAHRGTPDGLAKSGPAQFIPDPGSPWLNDQTCGQCHKQQVRTQWNSLMMTEAGKLQGAAWAFGGLTGYQTKWGNYDARNPKDPHARLGSDAYRVYMDKRRRLEPQVYPDSLSQVPKLTPDLTTLKDHPEQAVYTYVRSECQRCHTGVRGRQKRGDYRGMGCSSCHIPYGNEGLYEGNDRSIDRNKPGHLLVHSMQGTRDAKVTVHGQTYSGVPVETCTTCHDRGKRIGVSFQGLMESAFGSPYTDNGKEQPKLHTKHYIAMQQDIHYQKGMLCQDCHTSQDVHGDGFITGTNLAQVEIECSDCHGTPTKYPWELPLGRGEEAEGMRGKGQPRGTSETLPPGAQLGQMYPPEDGYLLSTRGNPLGNVVRRGNDVIVHTAAGKDKVLHPLKNVFADGKGDPAGRVAMVNVSKHVQTMECYTCHATWAPQCYGCHVRADYSKGKRSFDWIAAGNRHGKPGHLTDRGESGYDTFVAGHVKESRSYMRWEDPTLVNNGEGRVSPAIPGCQVSATVVGTDGKTIIENHVFHSKSGTEGGGKEGQATPDMSPVQPHTIGKARSCESCHASKKALGYGILGGKANRPWNAKTVVDLETADKKVLPKSARTQIEPVDGLQGDWSRIVTEDGKQLMTVGHHFKRSGPLTQKQRENMSREGVCLSCHQEIPERSLGVSVMHHIAQVTGKTPKNNEEHTSLLHSLLLLGAWTQLFGAAGAGFGIVGVSWWGARCWRRRRDAA